VAGTALGRKRKGTVAMEGKRRYVWMEVRPREEGNLEEESLWRTSAAKPRHTQPLSTHHASQSEKSIRLIKKALHICIPPQSPHPCVMVD